MKPEAAHAEWRICGHGYVLGGEEEASSEGESDPRAEEARLFLDGLGGWGLEGRVYCLKVF